MSIRSLNPTQFASHISGLVNEGGGGMLPSGGMAMPHTRVRAAMTEASGPSDSGTTTETTSTTSGAA